MSTDPQGLTRTKKDLARRAVNWIYSRDATPGGHLHRACRAHRRS